MEEKISISISKKNLIEFLKSDDICLYRSYLGEAADIVYSAKHSKLCPIARDKSISRAKELINLFKTALKNSKIFPTKYIWCSENLNSDGNQISEMMTIIFESMIEQLEEGCELLKH